jgi:hypothetical protein
MKPVQYRNRRPLEYLPHDLRLTLRSKRYYDRDFVVLRKYRKLPGLLVGISGLVILLAGELTKGSLGIVLFGAGAILMAVGTHFEIMNRLHHQYKYFIVPAVVVMLFGVYLFQPKIFAPLLPKQYVTELAGFSSGFPFDSTGLTVTFGGKDGVSATYTKRQLELAKNDSLPDSPTQAPFKAYLDSGKLFFDANVFAGSDQPPIQIRRDVIHGLPFGWDGNYSGRALEIVSTDTLPVFQLLFTSEDSVRIRGVFQVRQGLIIVDESGVSTAQKRRVLFYGTRPIFKYPSWKYPHQIMSASRPKAGQMHSAPQVGTTGAQD